MKTVNIRDARAGLSRLVDLALAGETVVITRNGRESACLGPVAAGVKRLPSLAGFRAGILLQSKGLSEEVLAARDQERF